MLTLLPMQYAKAEFPKIPEGYLTPAESTCYDKEEMSSIANFKKGCDLCQMNLKDTEITLNKCIDAGSPATKWWADPKFVVGGFALSFTLGAIVGLVVK